MTANTLILHPDTNLINWFYFPVVAMRRRIEYAAMLVIVMAAAVYLAISMLPLIASVFAVFAAVVGVPVIFTAYLAKQLTTTAVIYRPDSSGEPCEDFQSWWIEDALTWPDAYKFDYNGSRVLFIDALDKDDLKPFDPWISPPPGRDEKGKMAITGTRVASVRSQSAAVTRISKFRPVTRGQQIQQGLMVMAIGGSLLAIFMAADRVANVMGYGS